MAAVDPGLFGWEDLGARSDLERFYLVPDHLSDEHLQEMRNISAYCNDGTPRAPTMFHTPRVL